MTQVKYLHAADRAKPEKVSMPTRIEAISSSNNIKVTLKSATDKTGHETYQNEAKDADPSPAPLDDQAIIKPLSGVKPKGASLPTPGVRSGQYRIAAGVAVMALLGAVGAHLLLKGNGAQEDALSSSASAQDDFLTFVASASAADAEPAPVSNVSKSDERIAKLAAGTLTALRTHNTGQTAVAAVTQKTANDAAAVSALYRLVVTAHSQGQSMSYIDQMLNDAYARGEVSVPAGLITADNRVDTKAILSLFIAQ